MAKHITEAHGLVMEWEVARGHRYNAANPFVIWGYVNGQCQMQHAISRETAAHVDRCMQRVVDRLRQISQEAFRGN